MKTWTVPVESDPENPDDLLITIPDELLENAGWKPGDTLVWIIEGDSVILKKKEDE